MLAGEKNVNRLATDKRTAVIAALVEGASVNATCRMSGVAKHTVLNIDYAMLVKIYGASNGNPESRYSPATCIGCRSGVLAGNPDPDYISTSFVERSNLSMRMGMRRFTRLTNGFSKKVENHGHMVALYFMHSTFAEYTRRSESPRRWKRV